MIFFDFKTSLIQKLASVSLSKGLGLDSRETQKELNDKEIFEDEITKFMLNEKETKEGKIETEKPYFM